MIQIGEHRRFTTDTHSAKKDMEFIVRNIIVHNDSGDTYVGCEFFFPLRYGHDLSVAGANMYSGYYNEACAKDCGSYFLKETIEAYTTLIKAPEPDWEV